MVTYYIISVFIFDKLPEPLLVVFSGTEEDEQDLQAKLKIPAIKSSSLKSINIA